jgi:60 kDa SS-A/Ro ribonucleoprotein
LFNTKKLSNAGGGTNISAPMRKFNESFAKADWVLYVSDNESWLDSLEYDSRYSGTGLAHEWEKFKSRNPQAKLICCDLTPRNNSQMKTSKDVLQIGGFSDQVFEVVSSFLNPSDCEDHWVEAIEKINLG